MASAPATGERSPVRTPPRPITPQADATVGDFLYVPPGGLHGFRNQADEPASILMLFAPGGPREQYLESTPAMADMTDEQRREFPSGTTTTRSRKGSPQRHGKTPWAPHCARIANDHN
jgi:hypothetical protein